MSQDAPARPDSSKEPALDDRGNDGPAEDTVDKGQNIVDADSRSNRVRTITFIVLGVAFVILVWYLLADRMTPFTGNARVQAFVVPIVPEVSGYIIDIPVANNQRVSVNDVLVQIQPQRYELALQSADAQLELASQSVGAGGEQIRTAEARVAEARTNLEIYRIQAKRIISLEGTGAIALAQVDQARAEVTKRESELAAAEADLQRVRTELGTVGEENAAIRSAAAELERARLDLARTTIRAPSDGVVTDLQIDEGYYASAGQPLMTFISIDDTWIEAYMTENNLGRIKAGDPVEITFDVAPGRIVAGEVVSRGYGASAGKQSAAGDLPTVQSVRGWLRDPQRFPVVVRITDPQWISEDGRYRGGLKLSVGAQADAIVYTSDSTIMNALGAFYIRVISLFSYAY